MGKPLHGAAGIAEFALALQTTATDTGATFPHLATGKRGLKHALKRRKRTVCLFIDSTIFNEVPPLRAMWAPIGEQAEVPILGQHRAKRILTGVLNIHTGSYLQYSSEAYNQIPFSSFSSSFVVVGVAGTSCCFWTGFPHNGHTGVAVWRNNSLSDCAGYPKPVQN
jgi:hypothetical protein